MSYGSIIYNKKSYKAKNARNVEKTSYTRKDYIDVEKKKITIDNIGSMV